MPARRIWKCSLGLRLRRGFYGSICTRRKVCPPVTRISEVCWRSKPSLKKILTRRSHVFWYNHVIHVYMVLTSQKSYNWWEYGSEYNKHYDGSCLKFTLTVLCKPYPKAFLCTNTFLCTHLNIKPDVLFWARWLVQTFINIIYECPTRFFLGWVWDNIFERSI